MRRTRARQRRGEQAKMFSAPSAMWQRRHHMRSDSASRQICTGAYAVRGAATRVVVDARLPVAPHVFERP